MRQMRQACSLGFSDPLTKAQQCAGKPTQHFRTLALPNPTPHAAQDWQDWQAGLLGVRAIALKKASVALHIASNFPVGVATRGHKRRLRLQALLCDRRLKGRLQ